MAVYTEISDDDLNEFVAAYDIGQALSLKGIAEGVENSNFLLHTEKATYILTIYEKRVNPDDLPFFIGLMDHLAHKGLDCPQPIRDRAGNALRQLAGKPAALTSFLEGMWPRKVEVFHCGELGRAMAKFHTGGLDYNLSRENTLSLEGWRPLFDECAARADEVSPGLRDYLAKELDELEAQWPKPNSLPYGIIHADMFRDNVFFLQKKLSGIIDFYFACSDYLVYDLAICLNAWCFERDRSFNVTKAKKMIAGYQQVRPLSDDEINALPLLARGAAMRFLLTRLYDWLHHLEGAMVQPKDPLEYLAYLKFHSGIKSPAAYGIDI